MSYFVYVLSSKVAKKSYVGYTVDLKRRLREHNSGRSYFTKQFAPWIMIYTEEYSSMHEARERERYLKSHSGRKKVLRKIFEDLKK